MERSGGLGDDAVMNDDTYVNANEIQNINPERLDAILCSSPS